MDILIQSKQLKTNKMKKLFTLIALVIVLFSEVNAQTYEYKVITSVESIIPAGVGRSRLLENKTKVDVEDFTTERTEGTDSKQKSVKRKDMKIDEIDETKLLNFFSVSGINFQNIASNDAIVEAKLTAIGEEGWELAFVVSGVESDAGKDDGQGIYITRYIFKRLKD